MLKKIKKYLFFALFSLAAANHMPVLHAQENILKSNKKDQKKEVDEKNQQLLQETKTFFLSKYGNKENPITKFLEIYEQYKSQLEKEEELDTEEEIEVLKNIEPFLFGAKYSLGEEDKEKELENRYEQCFEKYWKPRYKKKIKQRILYQFQKGKLDARVVLQKKLSSINRKVKSVYPLIPISVRCEPSGDKKQINVFIVERNGEKLDLTIDIDADFIPLWVGLGKEFGKEETLVNGYSRADNFKNFFSTFLSKIDQKEIDQSKVSEKDIVDLLQSVYHCYIEEPIEQYAYMLSKRIIRENKGKYLDREAKKNFILKIHEKDKNTIISFSKMIKAYSEKLSEEIPINVDIKLPVNVDIKLEYESTTSVSSLSSYAIEEEIHKKENDTTGINQESAVSLLLLNKNESTKSKHRLSKKTNRDKTVKRFSTIAVISIVGFIVVALVSLYKKKSQEREENNDNENE